MKQLRLGLMIATIAASGFMLQSCAVQTQQQNLLQGQQYFQEQDYVHAFKMLKPLAQKGNADAQYALGYMYYYGKGVPKDYQLAVKWMRAAASQGQPLAQQALGQLQEQIVSNSNKGMLSGPANTNRSGLTATMTAEKPASASAAAPQAQ